jgi:hypothetical protein
MLMMQQLMKRTDCLFGMNLRREMCNPRNLLICYQKKSYAFLRVLALIVGFLAHIVGFLAHSCGAVFGIQYQK